MTTPNANIDPSLIERIVRDVMLRLEQTNKNTNRVLPVKPTTAPTTATAAATLTDRVISLEQIRDLRDITQLKVPTNAIVTPAVHDELRSRKIQLVKGDTANSAAGYHGGKQIQIGCLESNRQVIESHFANNPNYSVAIQSEKRVSWLVANIAKRLGHRENIILIVNEPFNAVCQANRHSNVRAAAIQSSEQLAQAKKEINANMMVLSDRDITLVTDTFIQQAVR